jgi:hypothetical protein
MTETPENETKFLYMGLQPEASPSKEAMAGGVALADELADAMIKGLAAHSVAASGDWWLWILKNTDSFPEGDYEPEPPMPNGKDHYLAALAKRLMSWRAVLSLPALFAEEDGELDSVGQIAALCGLWHVSQIAGAVNALLDPAGCGLEEGEEGVQVFKMVRIDPGQGNAP